MVMPGARTLRASASTHWSASPKAAIGPVAGLTIPILTGRPAARAVANSPGVVNAPAAPTPMALMPLRLDGKLRFSIMFGILPDYVAAILSLACRQWQSGARGCDDCAEEGAGAPNPEFASSLPQGGANFVIGTPEPSLRATAGSAQRADRGRGHIAFLSAETDAQIIGKISGLLIA